MTEHPRKDLSVRFIIERKKKVETSAKRIQAQVKWFNPELGYGFCKVPDKMDIFFTGKSLDRAGIKSVKEDEILEFDWIPVPDKGGKAINIKKIGK
jgi:cold shock CspA family protein